MSAILRALTAKVETWPALALYVLLTAAVALVFGLLIGREGSSLLVAVGALTLATGVGMALRLLWSRSEPAARTLDQQPPPQRLD